MITKTINIYTYDELPDDIKTKVASEISNFNLNFQFEDAIGFCKEMAEKFEGVYDFELPSNISYSQSDYVGVAFKFERTALKSNTIKKNRARLLRHG